MTATMTVMLNRVRNRLNEPSEMHWLNTQLRQWINEGAREIARAAECLPATGTIAVVAGTRQYSVSALTPQPIRFHDYATFTPSGDTNIYPLEFRDISAMSQVWGATAAISTGTPQYITSWGYFPSMSMILYPTPQSDGTLTLYYYRNPAAVNEAGSSDSSIVECPDGWEDCIVDYAEYRALRNDNRARWTDAQTEFNTRLQRLIDLTMRSNDGPGLIVTPSGGHVPAWLANPDY